MLNKGVEQGYGFGTGRALYHIRGEDMDNLVEDACHQITKAVMGLLDKTEFQKYFMFWLFPNYHMVVAINAQDLP